MASSQPFCRVNGNAILPVASANAWVVLVWPRRRSSPMAAGTFTLWFSGMSFGLYGLYFEGGAPLAVCMPSCSGVVWGLLAWACRVSGAVEVKAAITAE